MPASGQVIRDVSFSVQTGDRIDLVGRTAPARPS
jgi:ABC-type polysaccharide/polyol phosphate transport system ATPase subunit